MFFFLEIIILEFGFIVLINIVNFVEIWLILFVIKVIVIGCVKIIVVWGISNNEELISKDWMGSNNFLKFDKKLLNFIFFFELR